MERPLWRRVSDAGPLRDGRAGLWGRRTKASQGGNRGEVGGWLGGRALWGFWRHGPSAGGTSGAGDEDSSRRERRRRALFRRTVRAAGEGAAPGEGLASLRGRRLPAPARGWRRRRGEKWLRGGKRSDDHEVSIRMRLGDGDLAGRGPSKVSTMIIRPPQHGQRRGGGTSSAPLSAPARERWGASSDAASAWRARSMLSARTVPPNRP